MRMKTNYQSKEKYIMKKNRDMLLAESKIIQQNRKSQTQQLKDLNNKVEELTQALETLIFKLNRFISITKRHFQSIHFVKFVIDSIQKNKGINTSILVDIRMEKSMDIGLHISHTKN